jgi:hypothetical protein
MLDDPETFIDNPITKTTEFKKMGEEAAKQLKGILETGTSTIKECFEKARKTYLLYKRDL